MPSDALTTASVLHNRDFGAHCHMSPYMSRSCILPVMSAVGDRFGMTTLSGRLTLLRHDVTPALLEA